MTDKDKSIDSANLVSSFDDPHTSEASFGGEHTIPGQYSTLEDMSAHNGAYTTGLADFIDPSLDGSGEFGERTQTDLMAVPEDTINHEVQESLEDLLVDCLAVLDDFDKLIRTAREQKVDAKLIVDMEMSRKRLLGKLRNYDVEQMSCMGETMTLTLHEVVREVEVEDERDGTVTSVERAGFLRHGHPLRRARVTVGKKSS